ncbi:hypothetical protein ABT187_49115, partial [Streptomyces sp. NPDC001817]|uniref:hypothetical protein n=1 Tax=Streptomyces sp. NPDC001817 TaxID=3154398 RepID=UPI0033342BFD
HTQYTPARTYTPDGYFTTRDTYQLHNRHQAFGANPIEFIDPSGHVQLRFRGRHAVDESGGVEKLISVHVPGSASNPNDFNKSTPAYKALEREVRTLKEKHPIEYARSYYVTNPDIFGSKWHSPVPGRFSLPIAGILSADRPWHVDIDFSNRREKRRSAEMRKWNTIMEFDTDNPVHQALRERQLAIFSLMESQRRRGQDPYGGANMLPQLKAYAEIVKMLHKSQGVKEGVFPNNPTFLLKKEALITSGRQSAFALKNEIMATDYALFRPSSEIAKVMFM